ncbi:leucyl/phenylalanyl-tRNA--protein transferase [candidate division KSB1 bacterium]|nr:leucyl/phenylalanyl-tRNA--protein transferase [candidate division KSB1 bacterium]
MPIYRLVKEPIFPDPELATPDGLLAVGGDLSPERLLAAYRQGIFPWYSGDEPILWWSPEPRLILEPAAIHISQSLQKVLRRRKFEIRIDSEFAQVIQHCASSRRKGEHGTWITPEMQTAYVRLHELGFAHSVESWRESKLMGGLYGVSLGRAFFGESMFSQVANASKVALVALSRLLQGWEFHFIDCQIITPHLLSLGAKEVTRQEFLRRLQVSQEYPAFRGNWNGSERLINWD